MEVWLFIWVVVSSLFMFYSALAFLLGAKSFSSKEPWELLTRRLIMAAIWPILLLLWIGYVIITTDKEKFKAAHGIKFP